MDELEAENKLRRVHGGAELPHSLQEEETIQENLSKTFKRRSCWLRKHPLSSKGTRCHLFWMQEQQLLFIHELVNKNVTVVINSIHHAAQLVEKQIPTVMVGGSVKMATDAVIGGVAPIRLTNCTLTVPLSERNGVTRVTYNDP